MALQGFSLFLDFDGTLVEHASTPDGVAADAQLIALLASCRAALGGRLAVISGRPAQEIRALLGPDIQVVGSHGLEFLLEDTVDAPDRPLRLNDALVEMHDLAARWDGVLVEEKPLGAALHYRQNPLAAEESVALGRGIAERYGLQFQPGSMVAEVRVPGSNKGDAIRRLMAMPQMQGTRPVFLGDDFTDEPGFAAVSAMGGVAILVGPARATAAGYRLENVAAVRRWLAAEIGG